jgi:Clp amino terminal domain, pathogenicity island component/ClpX C4-type zinc finger
MASINIDAMDEVLLGEAVTARDRFIEAQHGTDTARAEYHHAIRRLHAAGGSMREIAQALGLSHQRVHQIVDAAAEPGPAKKTILGRLTGSSGPAAAGHHPAWDPRLMSADAQEVMALTDEQARSLGHHYIGTEHLLLGLLAAEDGIGSRILAAAGVREQQARADIEQIIGRGTGEVPAGPLRLTPRSKRALALARREARHDRSAHVRSEHILLGLLREGGGVAATVLTRLGVEDDDLRRPIREASLSCSFCERNGLDAPGLVAGPGVYICASCARQAAGLAADSEPASGVGGPASAGPAAGEPASGLITQVPAGRRNAACSFCGKKRADVDQLAASRAAAICGPCLALARDIQAERSHGT